MTSGDNLSTATSKRQKSRYLHTCFKKLRFGMLQISVLTRRGLIRGKGRAMTRYDWSSRSVTVHCHVWCLLYTPVKYFLLVTFRSSTREATPARFMALATLIPSDPLKPRRFDAHLVTTPVQIHNQHGCDRYRLYLRWQHPICELSCRHLL